MCKIICVTDSKSCSGDLEEQLERIAAASPSAVILREKQLGSEEYERLAIRVMDICGRYGVKCILHSHIKTAVRLGVKSIHLPLKMLLEMTCEEKGYFSEIGASCHSPGEAVSAVNAGAHYIVAGHIFETDCKKGLAGRGLGFLHDVTQSVSVPVYAIGGINERNISDVIKQGAAGVCIMSGLMQCDSPAEKIKALRGGI